MDIRNLIGETTEYDKKQALERKKPKCIKWKLQEKNNYVIIENTKRQIHSIC